MSDNLIGLNSWDQQKGEPTRWYNRFVHFRDMPDEMRSASRGHKTYPAKYEAIHNEPLPKRYSVNSWDKYAHLYKWRSRCSDWDRKVAAEKNIAVLEVKAEESKKMESRHATTMQAFQQALTVPVRAFNQAMKERSDEITEFIAGMPVDDMFKLLKDVASSMPALMKMERLSRGLPSDYLAQLTDRQRDLDSPGGAQVDARTLVQLIVSGDPSLARSAQEIAEKLMPIDVEGSKSDE